MTSRLTLIWYVLQCSVQGAPSFSTLIFHDQKMKIHDLSAQHIFPSKQYTTYECIKKLVATVPAACSTTVKKIKPLVYLHIFINISQQSNKNSFTVLEIVSTAVENWSVCKPVITVNSISLLFITWLYKWSRVTFTEWLSAVVKIPLHYHHFPWLSMTIAIFHDFPGLENGLPKFHDFPWV